MSTQFTASLRAYLSPSRWCARMAWAGLLLVFLNSGIAGCSIDAIGINFGNYNPFGNSPTDSNGSIKLRCTKKATVRIAFSKGNSDTYYPRIMNSSNSQLQYYLFVHANHTHVWGDGTQGTERKRLRLRRKKSVTLTVYGRIPAGQNTVKVGNYTDSIIVTVTY